MSFRKDSLMVRLLFQRLATITLLALLFIAALPSCEKADDNTVMMAQKCLDSAKTTSDANGCVAMVNGLTDSKASLIRCSGLFMANGVNNSGFASAFKALSDASKQGSGMNPSVALMNVLAMPDLTTAARVVSECVNSGSSGMVMVAAISQISTVFKVSFGLNSSSTTSQLQSCITNSSCGALQNPDVVGSAAMAAQAAYCGSGVSGSNANVCADLNAAIAAGGGNPTTIGTNLLNQYKNTK